MFSVTIPPIQIAKKLGCNIGNAQKKAHTIKNMNHEIVLLVGTLLVFGAMLWDRSKRIEEQKAEEKRLRDRDRVRRSYGLGR